jgi:hypothetical protein
VAKKRIVGRVCVVVGRRFRSQILRLVSVPVFEVGGSCQ